MPGTYVRVRVPSVGTAAGDFIAAHPDARMACIETGRTLDEGGLVIDHFALVEGVADAAIGELLLAWNRSYGIPAALAAGTPFAMRLPLPLDRVGSEVVARLKALETGAGTPVGHILADTTWDLWIACGSGDAARATADSARLQLPPGIGAQVSVGEPSRADQECWAALRLADEVTRPQHASLLA